MCHIGPVDLGSRHVAEVDVVGAPASTALDLDAHNHDSASVILSVMHLLHLPPTWIQTL